MSKAISNAAAALGRKGGQAKGKTKRRGDAAYYRELAQKSARVRREKAKKKE